MHRSLLHAPNPFHTTYDSANRLTTLTDDASQNFVYGYDIADRLISKTMPNAVTTTIEHDGMSRLKRLLHQSSSATIVDNNFGYNTANQIGQIAELGQTRNFGYDNVDRLTSMTNGTSNESYAFDAVGNRTSSHRSASYSYQPFNRMTATATSTLGYDANGNMTTKGEGSNLWRYTWDYENRMTMAATRKQTVRYQYDALGRRVRRYITGGRENTKFTYDGLDVVMDDDATTGITKYQNGLGIDDKLSLKNAGVTKYFVQDHLGSTVALTNSSGAVTEQTSYDSFGNQTTNLSTRYQYTGREYDPFSGFYYYRARWYDAGLGRFISEDPIGFRGQSINLYTYVENNPLRFSDPSGKLPIVVVVVVGGAVATEAALHVYLSYRAENISWPDADPHGRQRHCYVTCMSTRIHLGNPAPVTAGGLLKEGVNLYQAGDYADTAGDLAANNAGTLSAFVIWRSCEDLCRGCQ